LAAFPKRGLRARANLNGGELDKEPFLLDKEPFLRDERGHSCDMGVKEDNKRECSAPGPKCR